VPFADFDGRICISLDLPVFLMIQYKCSPVPGEHSRTFLAQLSNISGHFPISRVTFDKFGQSAILAVCCGFAVKIIFTYKNSALPPVALPGNQGGAFGLIFAENLFSE